MAKFMVLYSSSTSASDAMAQSTPEQMKASMEEWMVWQNEASKSAKLEWGLPLQAVGRITPDGLRVSDSHASGYATIECDTKDVAMELLKSHPHLKRADAYIDLLEMIPMPGM